MMFPVSIIIKNILFEMPHTLGHILFPPIISGRELRIQNVPTSTIFLTLGHPDFLYLHEITDSFVSSTKVTLGTKVLHCFRPSLLQIWQSPIGFSHGAMPTTYQYQ